MSQDINLLEKISDLRKSVIENKKPDFDDWENQKDKKFDPNETRIKLHNLSEAVLYGIKYFSAGTARNSGTYLDFSNFDFKNDVKSLGTDKFLDIYFTRNKGSHLAPFFLISKSDVKDTNIKYVKFSSIATDTLYPYVELKPIRYDGYDPVEEDEEEEEAEELSDDQTGEKNYCEVFFPIINQNQETADKMELIRDIIYAFFYYHNIKIIIQKAKYIVKDENLHERDAILSVGLSPFIRFPGLAASTSKDNQTINCYLYYHSTKLNQRDHEYIEEKFRTNAPGTNNKARSIDIDNNRKREKLSKIKSPYTKLNISTALIFDSKLRQMRAIGLSNVPFLDILYRRIKISYDIYKTFNYIIQSNQEPIEDSNIINQKLTSLAESKVVSFVDAGQRNSIMDVSSYISSSFFYDGNPGSSLCSYCNNINGSILYFTFRTADPTSMLANANAIAAALHISDVVVIPVNFPLYDFIQCFEYAVTRIDLFFVDINVGLSKIKSQIYLQFPKSTTKSQAEYFNNLFSKSLHNLGLETKSSYFIGTGGDDSEKEANDDSAKKTKNASAKKTKNASAKKAKDDSAKEDKDGSAEKAKESINKVSSQKSTSRFAGRRKKKTQTLQDIINALTAFSVINDYREYIDINLFFPSESRTEYKSFMFDQ